MREMREQGKGQDEIEEMLGGSLTDMDTGANEATDAVFVIASRLNGAVEFYLVEGMSFKLVYWTMGLVKGEPLTTHEQKWTPAAGGAGVWWDGRREHDAGPRERSDNRVGLQGFALRV